MSCLCLDIITETFDLVLNILVVKSNTILFINQHKKNHIHIIP